MATKRRDHRIGEDDRKLAAELQLRSGVDAEALWPRNRARPRKGHADLRYLPQGLTAWNMTLAGLAFSQARTRGRPDILLWAARHGARPSARAAELGDDALILWHGTSRERAERIREVGLFHKRGLWTTLEPRIAHGFTRWRSREQSAGSAMIVLVLDRNAFREGDHFELEGGNVMRFHRGLGAEHVEYICWPDRVEFVGSEAASAPRPWGKARFRREDGGWVPRSRPPVRLDDGREYGNFANGCI